MDSHCSVLNKQECNISRRYIIGIVCIFHSNTINIRAFLRSCAAHLQHVGVCDLLLPICLWLYVAVYKVIPVTHGGGLSKTLSLSAIFDSWWQQCRSWHPTWALIPDCHPSLTWLFCFVFLCRLTCWDKVPPRVPYISPPSPLDSAPYSWCVCMSSDKPSVLLGCGS